MNTDARGTAPRQQFPRPWAAVMTDGSQLRLMAASKAQAISSALELCPGGRLARVIAGGDW